MRIPAGLSRIISVLAGAIALAYLLSRFGGTSIWAAINAIGWKLSVIVALELLVHTTAARAWWYLFPAESRQRCFSRLWLVHLAGNALNELTPGMPIGGEPAKTLALKDRFEMSLTVATLLSVKLAHALARIAFIIIGLAAVWWSMQLQRLPIEALVIGFVALTVGVAIFMMLQVCGLSGSLRRLSNHLPLSPDWLERINRVLQPVERYAAELYRTRPRDFLMAIAIILVGLSIGTIQVWLIMTWMGHPCGWATSLAIESFSVLLGFVLFAVPGTLGVQEGGKVLIFAALGLPLSVGLSLGIIFRFNSLVNLVFGFAIFIWLRRTRLRVS